MAFLTFGKLCLLSLMFMSAATQTATGLKREKREWILPPTKLKENVDYTKQEYISKIRSDKDLEIKPIEYILRGHGADKEPFNLFVVNPKNGYVRITGILDREFLSQYNLTGIAKYKDGSLAEEEIMLKIQVEDENDNTPKFKISKGSVRECSKIGTPVMQITAEDADEQGTINAKIAYSIVEQIPEGSGNMFTIDRATGKIYVNKHTLDREVYDSYTLIVQGVDLDGAPHGNTGTGTVEIKVLDINDNVPTLEKEQHAGAVDEGAFNVVVMKIKALDKDLEKTDNWLAVFDIVKGNEDEIFTIETDPKTNEGILKLVKPVDYEKIKTLNIGLAISNVAPFINGTALSMGLSLDVDSFEKPRVVGGAEAGVDLNIDLGVDGNVEAGLGLGIEGGVEAGVSVGKPGTKPGKKPSSGGKSYPITISVNNLPEGPGFSPQVKELPVSEDPKEIKVPMVIGSFPAIDLDTGEIAENVRYAKGYDPDNWLSIDEETSEINLTKIPDRESKSLVNGTYIAKILCMTQDVPPKTATGTIALKVQDSNDHCPILTSIYQSICSDNKMVNVTAFDEDNYPNGEPYKFVLLEEETRGKWEMVPVNETTVSFHAKEPLWQGFYELSLEIFDKQGLGCKEKQKLQLEVCTCESNNTCDLNLAHQRKLSAKVGFPAISAIITALVLLLLIPLLMLFCQCGTFGEFSDLPFDTKEYLMEYNTEGNGEDKMVPLMLAPIAENHQKTLHSTSNHHGAAMLQTAHAFDARVFNKELNQGSMDVDSMYGYHHQTQNTLISTQRNRHHSATLQTKVQNIHKDIALPNDYLHGYFTQKARFLAESALSDSLLVCNDEGQYSLDATDLDSILEADNDLSFLNDLDMKFFTLATLCSSPAAKSEEVKQIVTSEKTSTNSESSVASGATQEVKSDQLSLQQNTSMNINETTNYQSTVSLPVNELGSVNAGSTLVMQQQPLYCLVEHQTPSPLILAKQPLQEMYLINGAQGLILKGGNMLQDAVEQQEMYLIDGMSMIQGNLMLGNCSNLLDAGSLAVSPVLVQEEKNRKQLKVSVAQDAQPGNSKAKEEPEEESKNGKKPTKPTMPQLELNK